jgi:hypothetical protein
MCDAVARMVGLRALPIGSQLVNPESTDGCGVTGATCRGTGKEQVLGVEVAVTDLTKSFGKQRIWGDVIGVPEDAHRVAQAGQGFDLHP